MKPSEGEKPSDGLILSYHYNLENNKLKREKTNKKVQIPWKKIIHFKSEIMFYRFLVSL